MKLQARAQGAKSNPKPEKAGFRISTDKRRLDQKLIYRFLSGCYWAKGIPLSVLQRSIDNALCFGLYKSGQQVGFARVISDFATFAYVGDVFVVESYRGRGLGKWLMQSIMAHPRLQGLRRWSLVTRDAHGLYSQFGFQPLKFPQHHMEVHNPRVYQKRRVEGRNRSSAARPRQSSEKRWS